MIEIQFYQPLAALSGCSVAPARLVVMKVRGAAAFGLADQHNGAYKSGPSVFLNCFPPQLYNSSLTSVL